MFVPRKDALPGARHPVEPTSASSAMSAEQAKWLSEAHHYNERAAQADLAADGWRFRALGALKHDRRDEANACLSAASGKDALAVECRRNADQALTFAGQHPRPKDQSPGASRAEGEQASKNTTPQGEES